MITQKINEISRGCGKEILGGIEMPTGKKVKGLLCGEYIEFVIGSKKKGICLCEVCREKLNLLKEIQSEIKKVIDEMEKDIEKESKFDDEEEHSMHFGMNQSLDDLKEKLGV